MRIDRIIVVAGGCTDGTEEIVAGYARRHPEIQLIIEPERRGKAAAINLFLSQARTEICVLQGADTLPGEDTIERLVAPLADPGVGMTGARIVPLNPKTTFAGYAVHFLWELHHQVALSQPKCGELVAFRRVFGAIPETTVVDEPQIEALVREAGLRTVYVPEAVVYNLGPSTVREIIMRRRSITAGYLALARRTRYRASTQARRAVAAAVIRRLLAGEEPLVPALGAAAIECLARCLGRLDYHFSRKPQHIWPMALSSKTPADFMQELNAPLKKDS